MQLVIKTFHERRAMNAKDKVIVALDFDTKAEAIALVHRLKEVVGMFKVGSQLFTSTGPQLVKEIIGGGNKVFLDLKFHDIPHQVAGSATAAAELGVSLFTLHASGGTEMMKRAVEAVAETAIRNGTERSRILAVSVLTSIDSTILEQVGFKDGPAEVVERLVALAESAGVDGCVSAPQETAAIRLMTGRDFLIVNPGIRPASGSAEDQKRVATPSTALKAGADYLVVGRPITSATDPVAAAIAIIQEMQSVERLSASNV